MKWLKKHKSRSTYIIIAATIALGIGFLWIYADKISINHQLELAERNRLLQVELARNAMEESFSRLIEENRILATHSFLEYVQGKRNTESMLNLLEAELSSYDESMVYAYYDQAGHASLIKTRPDLEFVVPKLDAAALRFWNNAPAPGTALVLDGGHDIPAVSIIVFFSVYNNNKMAGMLGTAINMDIAINKYLEPLHKGLERRAMLLFSNGRILWNSEHGNNPAFTDEKDVLTTASSFHLANAELSIIVDEPRKALLDDHKSIYIPRIIASIGGFLLLAVSFVIANHLYVGEIKRIALLDAENQLTEKVSIKEKELIEKELHYSLLFESAIDGIVLADQNFVITECNEAFSKLLELPKESIVGSSLTKLAALMQPDGRLSTEASIIIRENVLKGLLFDFEWLFKKSSGAVFNSSVRVSKIVFESEIMFQAFIRDITERKNYETQLKNALEDREILLKELHHRVKNNFQFLDSLVSIQKGMESPEGQLALCRVQARIAAVSAAYLVNTDKHDSLRIDARDYLSQLVSQAYDKNNKAMTHETMIDCDEIPLSMDTAATFGLLFHELVDNAFSHAYGKNTKGQLDITFKLEGQDAVLTLRDYGSGMPDEQKSGLGLTIVHALSQQLRGSYSIENMNPGTLVKLSFPLSVAPLGGPRA
ncbi:hypothetical protein MASR2M29_08120 [Spirochaetota bacterium]